MRKDDSPIAFRGLQLAVLLDAWDAARRLATQLEMIEFPQTQEEER